MTPGKTYRGVDGVEYRELIKPKRIEITRVEGPAALCDKVQVAEPGVIGDRTIDAWITAGSILLSNSASAPKGGGYDKHDFKIIFDDGLEYAGRYDLKHWHDEVPDLARHVRSFVEWCAHDPKAVSLLKPAQIKAAKQMLKHYDLHQSPVPA
jgi:hypothetical protein